MLIRNGSEGERLTGNVHCLCTKSRLSMTKCKMRVVPVFTLIINHCQRDEEALFKPDQERFYACSELCLRLIKYSSKNEERSEREKGRKGNAERVGPEFFPNYLLRRLCNEFS